MMSGLQLTNTHSSLKQEHSFAVLIALSFTWKIKMVRKNKKQSLLRLIEQIRHINVKA